MAVTGNGQRSFGEGMDLARAAGVGYATIPLEWDGIETSPGVYAPAVDWLEIARGYYPSIGWKVAIEVNPVDTLADRRPMWLRDLAWDDPAVIESLSGIVLQVLEQAEGLDIVSLTIGNEIDIKFYDDAEQWAAYATLFASVREAVHSVRPDVKVGVKTTFGGLSGATADHVSAIHAHADAVFLTYYPLDDLFRARDPGSVSADLTTMAQRFAGHEIQLAEVGYPSGDACAHGEEGQESFVRAFFDAWDLHAAQISAVHWNWMTDVSEDELNQTTGYYGIGDECFRAYLATLGLERQDVTAKPAWAAFNQKAAQRFRR